ncbi:MAG: methylated-DNA--[protein]-cysteine S-methyltransferase [Proteobacteria bacterium]|nr:methylated-DNA--[protein]-cysteine S-methyltransferase [Pseudomonadota bacterium]
MKKYWFYPAPFGDLMLVGENGKIEQVNFPNRHRNASPPQDWLLDQDEFTDAVQQFKEYFSGRRRTFSLELNPVGTDFQKTVWRELEKIPYGATIHYGELADRIGNPKASRAVGAANGRNPIPVVIPCHRVIGKDGSLTGFGGGLEVKKFLLHLETENKA